MRTLILLRGAPGCGKSTFIEKKGLKNYTISPDDIRMLYSNPQLQPDGSVRISQSLDSAVWKTVFSILESRMERGEFTVIDATNSKTCEMTRYKDLAHNYRYSMYVVDFTDVPLDTCLKQNHQRNELKWVPDEAIRNIYARFVTQTVPSGIKVIKPNDFDTIYDRNFIDLSQYEKVVHIGDIHGCYNTLMNFFEEYPFNDNYAYIFTGDYLDRGTQNAEVFKYLYDLKDKPNVCLLEGNHEVHIKNYGLGKAGSKQFELHTKRELINANIDDKIARMFYQKLRQISYYKWNDKKVLACHGGIPCFEGLKGLSYIPTIDYIKGVGKYDDYQLIAQTWNEKMNDTYLIHGHRNTMKSPIQMGDRVFNLEGQVEFGGSLRIVILDKDGFHSLEYQNTDYHEEETSVVQKSTQTLSEALADLKSNKFIIEKELGDDISSFNFSKDAFRDGVWNKQTILARGLFIDTKLPKIIARSYEKFFNLGEKKETEFSSLFETLKFPVTAYKKENGFLAMISYNHKTDSLFVATKSTNKGDYTDIVNKNCRELCVFEKVKDYLKDNDVTMVFECVDKDLDPHIIKYNENHMFLLDIVANTIEFQKLPYDELKEVASKLNLEVKEKAYIFNHFGELRSFIETEIGSNLNWKYKDNYIEGFVFEDTNGFMFKLKTPYYKKWKMLRGVSVTVLKRGSIKATSSLTCELDNYFYGFCKELYQDRINKGKDEYEFKTDIISLREMFENKGAI